MSEKDKPKTGRITDFNTLLKVYQGAARELKGLAEQAIKPKPIDPDKIPSYDGIKIGDNPYDKGLSDVGSSIEKTNALFADSISDIAKQKEALDQSRNVGLEAITKQMEETTKQLQEMHDYLKDTPSGSSLSGFTGNIENAPKIGVESDKVDYTSNPFANQKAKEELVQKIIDKMIDAGEFDHVTIEDVVRRIEEMNFTRRQLRGKSMEELQEILVSYEKKKEDPDDEKGFSK
jgi:hypothetical protein